MKHRVLKLIVLLGLFSVFSCNKNSIGMKMRTIPDGTFTRASENAKAREIQISSFLLSEREVSVAQFRTFLAETGLSHILNNTGNNEIGILAQFGYEHKALDEGFKIPDEWPAFYVSFFDAVKFCNWLSEKEGLEPSYEITDDPEYPNKSPVHWNKKASGYRLPTEAEWEYVCFSDYDKHAKDIAVLDFGTGEIVPQKTGSKKANKYGIYDMPGNVYEWCWDFYDVRYYVMSKTKNPRGPVKGFNPAPFDPDHTGLAPSTTDRVIKGGDFMTKADGNFNIMQRNFSAPSARINPRRKIAIGFRLARNIQKKK